MYFFLQCICNFLFRFVLSQYIFLSVFITKILDRWLFRFGHCLYFLAQHLQASFLDLLPQTTVHTQYKCANRVLKKTTGRVSPMLFHARCDGPSSTSHQLLPARPPDQTSSVRPWAMQISLFRAHQHSFVDHLWICRYAGPVSPSELAVGAPTRRQLSVTQFHARCHYWRTGISRPDKASVMVFRTIQRLRRVNSARWRPQWCTQF